MTLQELLDIGYKQIHTGREQFPNEPIIEEFEKTIGDITISYVRAGLNDTFEIQICFPMRNNMSASFLLRQGTLTLQQIENKAMNLYNINNREEF